jgi:AraC-like DNA-binding protein
MRLSDRPGHRVPSDHPQPQFVYQKYEAAGPAGAVVSHYWIVRATHCAVAVESALPDASVEIYFNLGTKGRYVADGSSHLAATHQRAWVLAPRGDPLLVGKEAVEYEIVGAHLRPGVVRRILGVPASDLGGGLVDLEALWGPTADAIREQLIAAGDAAERIGTLEREIVRRLRRGPTDRDTQVGNSLWSALGGSVNVPVSTIAQRYGLTHRRLIALFDQHVGLKPKTYDRVQRLRRVMRAVASSRRPSWAQVAVQAGYCDQAHLIHEFRSMTGLTPTEYDAKRLAVGDGFVCHRAAAAS